MEAPDGLPYLFFPLPASATGGGGGKDAASHAILYGNGAFDRVISNEVLCDGIRETSRRRIPRDPVYPKRNTARAKKM